MAPHPFTTIDPNVGFCLVPAPAGSCPEDDFNSVSAVACTHGRDCYGRRLLPVILKDVAGLVPGAYQGRGRGNKVRSHYNVIGVNGQCNITQYRSRQFTKSSLMILRMLMF
jgi:ribosome-binding ATPase YchF (GTP1/OBG family)